MKRFVSVLVTLSLLFSPLAWAGKIAKPEYNGTPRLSDYVLPIEAIEKMSPEDKMGYFVFLYHYVSFFELAQRKAVMKDKQASAMFDFFKRLEFNLPHLDFSLIPEAHALAPLIPLAAGAVARVAPVAIRLYPIYSRGIITYGSRAASWASRAWAGTKTAAKAGTLVYTGYEIRRATEPDSTALVSPPTPATLKQTPFPQKAAPNQTPFPSKLTKTDAPAAAPKTTGGGKSKGKTRRVAGGGAAAASGADAEASEGEVSEAATGEVPGNDYRAEGSACLYGGHNSKYIAKGDGLTCERPADSVNAEGCANEEAPTFKCETFGMLAGPKADDNISTGCVSLKPVDDLTVRCMQKLSEWLKSSPPPLLDKAAYTAWYASIIKNINEYEASFGSGVKFMDYCKDGNALNEGRQVDECKAVGELFSQVKKLTPPVAQVIAANAATQAAAPAVAPAKPAAAPPKAPPSAK